MGKGAWGGSLHFLCSGERAERFPRKQRAGPVCLRSGRCGMVSMPAGSVGPVCMQVGTEGPDFVQVGTSGPFYTQAGGSLRLYVNETVRVPREPGTSGRGFPAAERDLPVLILRWGGFNLQGERAVRFSCGPGASGSLLSLRDRVDRSRVPLQSLACVLSAQTPLPSAGTRDCGPFFCNVRTHMRLYEAGVQTGLRTRSPNDGPRWPTDFGPAACSGIRYDRRVKGALPLPTN